MTSEGPTFGESNTLRPHIAAWGGNHLFNQSKGFEVTALERIENSILSMHPEQFWPRGLTGFNGPPSDTFGVPASTRGQFEFALDHGFTPIQGRHGEFGTPREDEWYRSLPTDEKWRWPDGSIVESHDEVVVRRVDGSAVTIDDRFSGDDYAFTPSLHVDGVQEFFQQSAVDLVRLGTNGIWIDGANLWGRQRDFSEWAIESFRTHLNTLSQEALDRLGVDDPDSLDVVQEITSRNRLFSDDHPATDPLFREYTKHDFRTQKAFFENLRSALEEAFPERDGAFLLFGNLADPFTYPHISAILSDPMTFAAGESQKTVPPDHIYDFETKFWVAAGRFERSGFHMGPHLWFDAPTSTVFESDLDLSVVQTDFVAVHFAEQIANRTIGVADFQGDCCPLSRPITEQPGNWLRPDGSLPDSLEELTAFAWSTREILRGGAFAHDVAVVRSVPTNLWNTGSHPWQIDNEENKASFGGAANIATEDHRPYDVLIFGHPDLWDDEVMLERLVSYEQVILPSVTCLSTGQRDALSSALDNGVHVIIADEPPERNADFEPLSTSAQNEILDHSNTTVLSGTPARDYWNGEGDGRELREALAERAALVRTGVDSGLELTVQRHADPDRIVIQAVNYGFDLDAGEAIPVSDLELEVTDGFGTDLAAAKYYRPGERPRSLAVDTQGDRISVTLPTVEVWGVLVIGPDETAVSLAGDGSDAEDAISEATSAVERARAESRTAGLDDAEQFLTYAREARFYGAYARAESAANDALESAAAATQPPMIGIDTGHNQPGAGHSYDSFSDFRDAFIEPVTFTEVTEWTEASLADLEVLMVPPTYEHEGGPFGFTPDEADLLGEFVESGGGVLFIAQGGVASDHAVVSDQFGIGFKPGAVRRPGSWGSEELHRGDLHEINQTVLNIGGASPSAVVEAPDDGMGLLEYPETADLWRELCGDMGRQECDEDAAGEPFAVLLDHGSGTVMAHGGIRHTARPSWVGDFEAPWTDRTTILRNAIGYMAERASSVERVDQAETPTSTKAKETSIPDETKPRSTENTAARGADETTAADAPGFSLLTGLAGIAAGLGAVSRWIESKKRDN